MSADFPIRLETSAPGAREAASDMDAVFEVMRKGSAVSEETAQKFRQVRLEMWEKRKALMVLRYGYLQAHPTMMLFTRAMSTVASVARTAVGIVNSYNLMLLTLKNRGSELAKTQYEVEVATRKVQDLENQGLKDSLQWVTAKEDLNEITERYTTLQKDAADETFRVNTQLGLLGLTSISTGVVAIPKLYDAFKDLAFVLGFAGLAGGALFGAILFLAGGLAIGTAAVILNKKEGESWADTINRMIGEAAGLPPVLREIWQVFLAAGGGMAIIGEAMGRALVGFGKVIYDALATAKTTFDTWTLETNELLNNAWNTLVSVAQGTWKLITGAIMGTIEEVWDWLKSGWNTFKDTLGGVWDKFVGVAKEVWDRITGTIKGIANDAWTWISEGWKALSGALETIWNGLKGVAKTVWDGITATIKSAINGVIYLINQLIGAINSIKMTFPDWVPLLGGKTFGFNIAPISYLQKGGVVTGPTLAMLGERGPEAVIPLDRGGVGGAGKTINIGAINVYATGKTQAREISRELVLELNRYIRWS